MPTFTVDKDYQDTVDLTESQLDAAFDSIETFLNTTKIDGDNIQAGGVPTAALATGAVTAAKIDASAVTTAKIADSNVTTAKINDLAVTTAKINDLGVTTGKINTAAVTQAKLAARTTTTDGTDPGAGGVVFSASSASFTTTSTTYVDVTNLSVTLTTTGRPVRITLDTADGSTTSTVGSTRASSGAQVYVLLKAVRDATDIKIVGLEQTSGSSSGSVDLKVPPGVVDFIDTPAAGTYVYKLQAEVGANMTANVTACRLMAYEI